jgi:hypothetical protein
MNQISRNIPDAQYQALIGANSPSALNKFATMNDISGATFNRITVETNGGDFTSVVAALDSITTNTSTNRFIIEVGVGTFVETLIDLASKPYVSIKGTAINTTIIEPSANNHHCIRLGVYNEISFMSLQGLGGVGFAGIYTLDGGVFSQAHKVSIYNFNICVSAKTTIVDSQLFLEYVDFSGAFAYGIKVENSGPGINFVNAENQYGYPTSGLTTMYEITGANSKFELNVSGNEPSTTQGNGIVVHSGSQVNIFSTYFNKFTTGISMPNTGATPTLFCSAVKTQDCTTDISVAHITGQGCFIGMMNNPTISIVSTSTFAVSYLESLLGNIQILYYDPYAISPVAVTSPVAAACTTVNQSSVTGLIALSFSGVADQNASMNFRVPNDYLRNGKFKISWSTSATSANNVYFAPILSVKEVGDSLITQTETLTPQTIAAGTINLRQETAYFVPTTAFVKGQLGVLRLTRGATNAADTFTGGIFVNGVIFEYESSK